MEYLYIIKEEPNNHYKIGRAYDVASRVQQIQTSNPNKLILKKKFKCQDCKLLESRAHKHLLSKQMVGEWFLLTDEEVQDCIQTILKLIIEIHKRIKQNTCNVCNFKTYKNENFQKHLESNAHKKRVLNSESTIKKENDTEDDTDTRFICKDCNYKTDRIFCYKKHLNTTKHARKMNEVLTATSDAPQNSVKKYNCSYCNITYTRSSNLTRHQKICPVKIHNDKKKELESDLNSHKQEINIMKELHKQQQDEIIYLKKVYMKLING